MFKEYHNKWLFIALALVLMSFVVGISMMPALPEMMVTHWDAQGAANGWLPRFWGTAILPCLLLAVFLFMVYMPQADPLYSNVLLFKDEYYQFIAILAAFMDFVYFISLGINLGIKIDIIQAMMPAMALLFFFIGALMKSAKRNYFVGIRTPWTLASDEVWDKTHAVASKLFQGYALLLFSGMFFPDAAIFVVIAFILTISFYLYVYSYLEFKKIEARDKVHNAKPKAR